MCLGDKTGSSAIALLSTNTSFFIFDSHSRDNSGMPCANGTAILMKFNNIDSTVSYICQLAHELSASLFHWTFWHAQADVECDCKRTSETETVHAIGMLLHDEILKMCSEFTPTVPEQHSRKKYYASYKRKVRQQETHDESKQRKQSDKIQKKTRRANETSEQSQARKDADKMQKSKTRSSQKK